MNLVLIKDDSTIGAASLASKLSDPSLDLKKHFSTHALTTQLDHLYLKKIIKFNGKEVYNNSDCSDVNQNQKKVIEI